MLKKIFFFLLGLIALGLIGLFFFGSAIVNTGVETTINTIGPKITQTSVSVEKVDLSLASGGGTVSGIKVGNPEGYANENILELGEVQVEVKPTSLTSDTVVVKKVHIKSPKISYEKNLKGSNLKDLQNNIKAFTTSLLGPQNDSPEASTQAAASTKPAKKVIIEDFQIQDGTVYAGLMGVGMEIPLPAISFQNIGAKDGPSFAEIGDQIFEEILNVIGPALQNSKDFIGKSGKAALETTKDEVIDRGVGEVMKLFGQ